MYDLLGNRNNYQKTSGSLCLYCRFESDDNITDSKSFRFISSFTDNTGDYGTVDLETAM